jgi:hypothetical protein
MNGKIIAFGVAAAVGSLSAASCGTKATPPPSTAVTSSATTSSAARQKAFQAAAAALSHDAHVPRDSTAGVSQEETTWPNSCLGCPKTGESCAQVLTPGYRVVLRAADATYEYHTDLGGTARLCSQSSPGYPPPPAASGAAPTPAAAPTPYP